VGQYIAGALSKKIIEALTFLERRVSASKKY
jgi:hypothetical protein